MIFVFPKEIAKIIAEYSAEYELLPWVPREVLEEINILANPNAYYAGIFTTDDVVYDNIEYFRQNPALAEWIKENDKDYAESDLIWRNPALFEWLIEKGLEPNWMFLTDNPHPKAIELLLKNPDQRMWPDFCSNPGAMPFLREHPERINDIWICANPAAIDIIKTLECINNIDINFLSSNSHPWALNKLSRNIDSVDISSLARNPGIFEPKVNKTLIKLLSRPPCPTCGK